MRSVYNVCVQLLRNEFTLIFDISPMCFIKSWNLILFSNHLATNELLSYRLRFSIYTVNN
jgi:hypothetical protein